MRKLETYMDWCKRCNSDIPVRGVTLNDAFVCEECIRLICEDLEIDHDESPWGDFNEEDKDA